MTSTEQPAKCPGSRGGCEHGGKWGATGILPPGHHIHYTQNGAYLAHGKPSDEDRARFVAEVTIAHARKVERLNARMQERLAPIQ